MEERLRSASAAPGPQSGSASAGAPASFSSGDSAASLSLAAPTNKAVNNPPLKRVLRKNTQVGGQPAVPLINAVSQPSHVLLYSTLLNGLNSQEIVLVITKFEQIWTP